MKKFLILLALSFLIAPAIKKVSFWACQHMGYEFHTATKQDQRLGKVFYVSPVGSLFLLAHCSMRKYAKTK